MNLAEILKDSNYKLSQFTETEIEQLEQSITLKTTKSGEVPYTVCLARQKAIKLTPEEAIRQLYLRVLTDRLHYPLSRIQVEYGVNFGREVKRADIVVMDKDRPNTVYMLVESKKPKLNVQHVQQYFVDKVNQSYDAEDKSKQLLEIAKTGVERAIETDEETATAWINQQLEEALKINLSNSN